MYSGILCVLVVRVVDVFSVSLVWLPVCMVVVIV